MYLEQKQIPEKLKPPKDEDYCKYNDLYMSENESLERKYEESDEVRSTTTLIMQTPLKKKRYHSGKRSCGSLAHLSDDFPATPPRSATKNLLTSDRFRRAFNETIKL